MTYLREDLPKVTSVNAGMIPGRNNNKKHIIKFPIYDPHVDWSEILLCMEFIAWFTPPLN